jgi:hypothetical protein
MIVESYVSPPSCPMAISSTTSLHGYAVITPAA